MYQSVKTSARNTATSVRPARRNPHAALASETGGALTVVFRSIGVQNATPGTLDTNCGPWRMIQVSETLRQFTARMKRAGWTKTGSAADGILFTWPANGYKFYALDFSESDGCEQWQLYADGESEPPPF